tara:strand:- start:7371 stop:8087 length:717 start_codon:yes stop_codon:yes gene_type:complete
MPSNSSVSTLSSVIKLGIESALKELHTSMPGIVESFDPVTQLASIQPAIKRIFKTQDEDVEILTPTSLPILINVPVIFPRGGGFSLTFPVAKGDECLLNFCERSIDNWHQTGEVKVPGANRLHSLSDAVAFVGISSVINKVPNYDNTNVQLKKDDDSASITLLTNGTIKLKADTKVIADAPDVETTGNLKVLGNLEVVGSSTLSDTVTSDGVDISGLHTHVGSPTAPLGVISPTGTPV